MQKNYDHDLATKLVPLLRSITREMRERTHAIEHLEAKLRDALRKPPGTDPDGLAQVQAELATQKRELRHTRKDLERLGCVLDESHPLRVLIPGNRGDFEYMIGSNTVEPSGADSTV
jgi:hypothetical protein